jgi:hypothetical protein
MSAGRKRQKVPDNYDRLIEQMIVDYVAATGDQEWSREKVARWAIEQDRWEQRQANAVKELSRVIGRVARKTTFTNEDGDEVRKYHSWRPGPKQPTFWSSMEAITPEHMRESINARRDKLVDGAVKVTIDAEHYNKHHNPGDPIVVDPDLSRDVREKRAPGLYDDVAPDDSEPS